MTQNGVESNQTAADGGDTMWHAVVVYRLHERLYVFDPSFEAKNTESNITRRLRDVRGLQNVRRLLNLMREKRWKVKEIWVTGSNDVEDRCSELSCKWLEGLVKGKIKVGECNWERLYD